MKYFNKSIHITEKCTKIILDCKYFIKQYDTLTLSLPIWFPYM